MELPSICCRTLLISYLKKLFADSDEIGWDVVLISARDVYQKRAFELQLKGHFPGKLGHKFHVIADPEVRPPREAPGEVGAGKQGDAQTQAKTGTERGREAEAEAEPKWKIGSGGSTIWVLKWLKRVFGAAVFTEKKVLLLHSGGYSQRVPMYSLTGKLFASIPISVGCQLRRPWTALDVKLALLAPFSSKIPAGLWVTASDDIVLFSVNEAEFKAMPCFDEDVIVALGHPSSLSIAKNHGVYLLEEEAEEETHPKSVFTRNCRTVLQKPSLDQMQENGAVLVKGGEEYAITDSSYWMGPQVLKKLVDFPLESLTAELDAYGHFLCPLGSRPLTREVMKRGEKEYHSPIESYLSGTHLKILFLPNSTFYHLGTIQEYLLELTHWKGRQLAEELCFATQSTATVMASVLDPKSDLDSNSLIEYCHFAVPIKTKGNILYNCMVHGKVAADLIEFPPNYLFYGLPIQREHQTVDATYWATYWVTIGVPIEADFKSSLWEAKLFPVCDNPSDSLLMTIDSVTGVTLFDRELVSISDTIRMKDIEAMISIQSNHMASIASQVIATH